MQFDLIETENDLERSVSLGFCDDSEDEPTGPANMGTLFMGEGSKSNKNHDDDDDDDDDYDDGDEPEAESSEPRPPVESAKPKTLTRKEAIEILQTTRDFSELDLRKANLTKLDFTGCRFVGSNLSYVNFKDSNLEACDFTNASLWNANLEGANLTRAVLEDADLDYTKLRGALLYKANIRRATLPTDLIPRDEILKSVNEGTKISR